MAKNNTDKMMEQLLGVVGSLAESVKALKEEVKELKSPDVENKSEIEKVKKLLEERSKVYKPRSYKVLRYTEIYYDANGDQKKNYTLPGQTFKDYESAKAFVEKNPNWKFDILPV